MRKMFFIPIILSLIGLAAIWVQVQGKQAERNNLAGIFATPDVRVQSADAAILAAQLTDDTLGPGVRSALEEKVLLANKVEEQFAAQDREPAAKNPQQFQAVMGIGGNPEPERGIFPGSDGMVRPQQAKINNYWQGRANGWDIFVFAGSDPFDQEKGRLLVMQFPADDPTANGNTLVIDVDGDFGSLTIDREEEGRLILSGSSGAEAVFDLATLSLQ